MLFGAATVAGADAVVEAPAGGADADGVALLPIWPLPAPEAAEPLDLQEPSRPAAAAATGTVSSVRRTNIGSSGGSWRRRLCRNGLPGNLYESGRNR